jgi:dTMP kinase
MQASESKASSSIASPVKNTSVEKAKGLFITFEGGEGAGKSTQTQLLAEYLRLKGRDVVLTREPGGTDGAELIRSLLVSGSINRWTPVTEALLMTAARIDHWVKIIKTALDEGKWVICDRYFDSTLAYQGYGRGVDIGFLKRLHQEVLPNSLPDRTYVFDVDPHVAIPRALSRHTGETRFEKMGMDFHERMRQGYMEIAVHESQRCFVIDASKEISQIHQLIVKDLEDWVSNSCVL